MRFLWNYLYTSNDHSLVIAFGQRLHVCARIPLIFLYNCYKNHSFIWYVDPVVYKNVSRIQVVLTAVVHL